MISFKKLKPATLIILFLSLFALGLIFLSLRSQPSTPLQIISTTPAQNQNHNLFLPLKINFNQTPDIEKLAITLNPPVDFTTSIENNQTLIISPQPQFSPFTNYSLTLLLPEPFEFRFSTLSEVGSSPDWNQLFQTASDQYSKEYGTQNEALTKIRRSVPITQNNFTINYDYQNNTYSITLTKKPYDQTKNQVLDWLKNQGITHPDQLRLNWIEP